MIKKLLIVILIIGSVVLVINFLPGFGSFTSNQAVLYKGARAIMGGVTALDQAGADELLANDLEISQTSIKFGELLCADPQTVFENVRNEDLFATELGLPLQGSGIVATEAKLAVNNCDGGPIWRYLLFEDGTVMLLWEGTGLLFEPR